MYQAFESLPEDKKKKIMDVSLEEFAVNGFGKASTNAIVKKAGISKGILYHYFGSKRNLYLYLFDYVVDYFLDEFYSTYKSQPPDIFDRLAEISRRKMKITYENPLMSKFVLAAFTNVPNDLKGEIQERYNKLYDISVPKMLEDIDLSKFRKGIDQEKALEMLVMCMDALANKFIRLNRNKVDMAMQDMEKINEESMEYIEMLKYGFYER